MIFLGKKFHLVVLGGNHLNKLLAIIYETLTVKNPTIMTSTGQNSSPAAHATAPSTKRKAA